MNRNYRECPTCKDPVHRNRKECPGCGGVSPWKTEAVKPEFNTITDEQMLATAAEEISERVTAEEAGLVAGGSLTVADAIHAKDILAGKPSRSGPLELVVDGPGEMALAATLLTDDLNPSDAEVAGYIGTLPDAAATARANQALIDEARTGPHVFMEKFSCMLGPVLCHFKANDVVTDFRMIMALQAENAPMVPVGESPGMVCCPSCKTVFKAPRIVPARRAG